VDPGKFTRLKVIAGINSNNSRRDAARIIELPHHVAERKELSGQR
jgi:hypothetical protein